MKKKTLYHIIEWTIALAGCGFLAWKLATYDDYASLAESLRSMGWAEWSALALCLLMMPLNMTIEAWRWRTLIPMSWREAHRQVYYSKLAGLITPWRLGEYPSRALLMKSEESEAEGKKSVWARALSMGAVGSVTMTFAIVVVGIIAMLLEIGNLEFEMGDYWMIVTAVLLLLIVAMILAPRLLRRWADVSHTLIIRSVGQSIVRLACWCIQLALVIYALAGSQIVDLRFEILDLLLKTPVYYLLVTITPNVPIAEVGVRGAWGIVVFGTMNAALAGVLLWGINTLLPCLAWFFLKKK